MTWLWCVWKRSILCSPFPASFLRSLKILGHAPILILVIHTCWGWVALSTLQRAKRARLQKRVQAKTQDLWVQLLTLMKCLLCQSICLFILFVSGEFHLAHLSTLKLAASCSKLRNGEFMSTHWILTFNCIEISLFHSSLKHKNWQKTRPSVKTRSSF